jgi:hypothetical protein
MSKIRLASSSEVWLVNLPGEPFNHFLSNDMEGLGLTGCRAVFQESLVREMDVTAQMANHNADEFQAEPETRSRDRDETVDAFPMTYILSHNIALSNILGIRTLQYFQYNLNRYTLNS